MRKIQDAYISVELKADGIQRFREGLRETLNCQGVHCEDASPDVHVSIAYAKGEALVEEIQQAARAIARTGFQVRARGFEILEGRTTEYDYLVVSLEQAGDFEAALSIVERRFPTRSFDGGFKGHVSLLRFRKGSIPNATIEAVVRELNASHGAMFSLGRCWNLDGECVCVASLGTRIRVQMHDTHEPMLMSQAV